jgi:hypothetical protein
MLSTISQFSMPGVVAEELSAEHGKLAEKTYDDNGQTFQILHLNTDKLPKLISGNDLEVKIPTKRISPIQPPNQAAAQFSDNIIRRYGPKQSDYTVEGNLNIKANMTAGHGIVYKEDNHREIGPSYIEKFKSK